MRLLAAMFLCPALAVIGARAGEADPAGDLLKPLSQGAAGCQAVAGKLVEAAASRDEFARQAAAAAVSRLGPQDAALAPFLAAVLADGRGEVRRMALEGLLRVPSGDPAVLQAIVNRTRDPEIDARVLAIRAMAAAGSASKASLQALAGMLSDQEPRVREAAAAALGNLRSEAKPALQLLVNLLADKDPAVRRAAVGALGRVGDPAALGVLLQFAQGAKDDADLGAAYDAFLEMGEAGLPARDYLRKLVYDRREKWGAVDIRGLGALARMTGQADPFAADLAAFLKDAEKGREAAAMLARAPAAAAGVADKLLAGLKEEATAPMCARVLGRIGASLHAPGAQAGKSFVPALVALLDSEDDAASSAALRALGDIGDLSAAPEVAKRVDKFGDESQVWLQYALTRLKQEPDQAMGRLRVMGADPWRRRRLAQQVLQYLEAGGRGDLADE